MLVVSRLLSAVFVVVVVAVLVLVLVVAVVGFGGVVVCCWR